MRRFVTGSFSLALALAIDARPSLALETDFIPVKPLVVEEPSNPQDPRITQLNEAMKTFASATVAALREQREIMERDRAELSEQIQNATRKTRRDLEAKLAKQDVKIAELEQKIAELEQKIAELTDISGTVKVTAEKAEGVATKAQADATKAQADATKAQADATKAQADATEAKTVATEAKTVAGHAFEKATLALDAIRILQQAGVVTADQVASLSEAIRYLTTDLRDEDREIRAMKKELEARLEKALDEVKKASNGDNAKLDAARAQIAEISAALKNCEQQVKALKDANERQGFFARLGRMLDDVSCKLIPTLCVVAPPTATASTTPAAPTSATTTNTLASNTATPAAK